MTQDSRDSTQSRLPGYGVSTRTVQSESREFGRFGLILDAKRHTQKYSIENFHARTQRAAYLCLPVLPTLPAPFVMAPKSGAKKTPPKGKGKSKASERPQTPTKNGTKKKSLPTKTSAAAPSPAPAVPKTSLGPNKERRGSGSSLKGLAPAPAPAPQEPLPTSSELHALAADCRAEAASVSGTSASLAAKLGAEIQASGLTPHEIFKEWDLDGNGAISKTEFRFAVRKMRLVGDTSIPESMFKFKSLTKEEMAACDGLFGQFDLDDGGDLDLNELEAGLVKVREEAALVEQQKEQVKLKIEDAESRATLWDRAAAAVEAVEATKAKFAEVSEKQTIDLRVGKQLNRHSKTAPIKTLWAGSSETLDITDEQDNVVVEFKAVLEGLHTCGVEDEDEELSQLIIRSCNLDAGSTSVELGVMNAAAEAIVDLHNKRETELKDLRIQMDAEYHKAEGMVRAARAGLRRK